MCIWCTLLYCDYYWLSSDDGVKVFHRNVMNTIVCIVITFCLFWGSLGEIILSVKLSSLWCFVIDQPRSVFKFSEILIHISTFCLVAALRVTGRAGHFCQNDREFASPVRILWLRMGKGRCAHRNSKISRLKNARNATPPQYMWNRHPLIETHRRI